MEQAKKGKDGRKERKGNKDKARGCWGFVLSDEISLASLLIFIIVPLKKPSKEEKEQEKPPLGETKALCLVSE